MCKFSHLHVHTEFSLLDGLSNISDIYKKAIEEKMPAIAITDHGNMFGVFKFVSEAYKYTENNIPKVKPIVGCEFYVVENRHIKNFTKEVKDNRRHQVMLAKNKEGYKNLMQLCSLGFIEGLYSKYPRIDKELIKKYNKGIIATTCCLAGSVPDKILKEGELSGEEEFKWWLDIFGEDYYVEIQRHNIKEQNIVNEILLKFAKKYNVKVIASNDAHYVNKQDAELHDILLCINTGEKKSTPIFSNLNDDDTIIKNKRFGFNGDHYYLKSVSEMKELFIDIPESIDNTNEIVGKIELLDLKRDVLLPHFTMPENFKTQSEYLDFLTWNGAKNRYQIFTQEIEQRINFELETIHKMGFDGYFLIVADFIDAAKKMDVMVGPGRGSAAGSVVAYCLGITNIDPIKYQLLFERFLNPDRKSLPDIDTDFDDLGRQKVINYVVDKYGKNQVAQIITYGSMAAKNSIKDVSRVLDIPLQDATYLTKLVPNTPGITLKKLFNADEDFKKDYQGIEKSNIEELQKIVKDNKSNFYEILNFSGKIDGTTRNVGVHAAGILIAPENLTDIIPICKVKDSEMWVSQIDGDDIEKAGAIKMDFLGLKTLTILKKTLNLVQKNYNIIIDIDKIPLDDKNTFKIYQEGNTNGIFQFENDGMKKYLKELNPDKLEDLIAMNALYRPGPISYIPDFIKRKHGSQKVTYDLDIMEEYLKETYGITVYQEQVMLLSQKIANFSKGDADALRKIMGKKKANELAPVKEKFLNQGLKNGHNKNTLEKIWEDWAKFAGYAFNKSHSTCYALLSYQQAYLKAYYPKEFMCATLDNYAQDIKELGFYMEETKRMKIEVLPPDINESFETFAVNNNGQIRFGLLAIKGIGENVVKIIIEEREKNGIYNNIYDLVNRLDKKTINKKSLEALIYSGALESFSNIHRAKYFCISKKDGISNFDKILKYASQTQSVKENISVGLFEGTSSNIEIKKPILDDCEPWTLMEKINYEKEYTGMFLSGHPLDPYKFELNNFNLINIAQIKQIEQNLIEKTTNLQVLKFAGFITNVQHRIDKNGNKFGIIILEDYTDKIELSFWKDQYLKVEHILKNETLVFCEIQFEKKFNSSEFRIKVLNIELLENLKLKLPKDLKVTINLDTIKKDFVEFFTKNIKNNPGNTNIYFEIINTYNQILNLKSNFKCSLNEDLIQFISDTNNNINYKIEV